MKKLIDKFGKRFVIAYVAVDCSCTVALFAWYFSPWWPL